MFQLAVLGALFLVIILFCAKFMRRGYTSLDENRKKYLERIGQDERQLQEDRKRIASSEHLHILRVALEDLIRLEDDRSGYTLESTGSGMALGTPKGTWHIELLMRERKLRSCSRTLHGRSRWRLEGPNVCEEYMDIAAAMSELNARLHGTAPVPGEPEHLARRMAGGHSLHGF